MVRIDAEHALVCLTCRAQIALRLPAASEIEMPLRCNRIQGHGPLEIADRQAASRLLEARGCQAEPRPAGGKPGGQLDCAPICRGGFLPSGCIGETLSERVMGIAKFGRGLRCDSKPGDRFGRQPLLEQQLPQQVRCNRMPRMLRNDRFVNRARRSELAGLMQLDGAIEPALEHCRRIEHAFRFRQRIG